MKKIALLLVMATMMWSCNSSTKKTGEPKKITEEAKKIIAATDPNGLKIAAPKVSTPTNPVYKSLNGINEGDAEQMAQLFESNIFKKTYPRAKISFWFSKDILAKMKALLEDELGTNPSNTQGYPDGFRIYFVNEHPNDEGDLSVSIVSTFNKGTDPKNPGFTWHQDYYEHNGDADLFKIGNIKGERGVGDCDGGGLLYVHCPGDTCKDENCGILQNRRIPRGYQETMASLFGNSKINTKSVWFDLDLLQALFDSKLKFDGIRLYFSNYGTVDEYGNIIKPAPDSNGDEKKRNRDTFIFMLTKSVGTIHRDQFECEYGEKDFRKGRSKFEGYNNGELCPSHCN